MPQVKVTWKRRIALIRKGLRTLLGEGAVAELRAPKTPQGTLSGYFDDLSLLARAAARVSGKAPGVYITINPVRPELLARARNRLVPYAEKTTNDAGILRRVWLPVDFDAVRPPGISATEPEHQAALKRSQQIMDWLQTRGFPLPVVADSGNGGHLAYRIDLPNDENSTQLLKQCLQALALRFNDDKVVVDLSTYNASRIWKVYGTLAAKGPNTPVRPHRRAKLLEAPSCIKTVSRECLEQLAATVPQSPKGKWKKNSFDLNTWLSEHEIPVVAEAPWNGGRKFILDPCPWNPQHVNKSAYVVQMQNGAIAAGCHHQSCADNHWPELRAMFDSDWDSGEAQQSPKQANILIGLADTAELFHTPEGEAFATVPVDQHSENWPIRSQRFCQWLLRGYYLETKSAPQSSAVQEALGILESRAHFDGAERPVFLRVAETDGKIFLDLCNENWEVIEIDSKGWRLLSQAPVRFRRARGMSALPQPTHGGSVDQLRPFVNISSEFDWTLLQAWLMAALRGRGPFPIVVEHGEQGSAKSTTARVLRALVDPSTAPLRSEPREVRDLMIAASNGWVISLDNISRIPQWLSDALCRLSTGGGFSTRELYSDSDETILDAQRPVILNGIEELAVRGDLLDRCLILYLPSIPEGKRRPEVSFWKEFELARPAILGALLGAVSGALRRLPKVKLTEMPRMADFAMWATAAEPLLGWRAGAFMKAYTRNQVSSNELALDASPITEPIRRLVAEDGFQGTAAELLKILTNQPDDNKPQRGWPRTPQYLSNMLRRLVPNLRKCGIEVLFFRGKDRRRRRLIRIREMASTPSASFQQSDASDV